VHAKSSSGTIAAVTALLKKVHLYAGLVAFAALVVYGIAGLTATFASHRDGEPPAGAVRFEPYTAPTGASDKDIADDVHRRLQPPLAGQVPKFALRRDQHNDLTLTFYSVNGPTRVTVLEKEGRLRVEDARNGLWKFFNNLHATTSEGNTSDLRLKLWTAYNEVALWSLSLMMLSGVYLGLASRPRFRWGKYALALGSTAFVVLYAITR